MSSSRSRFYTQLPADRHGGISYEPPVVIEATPVGELHSPEGRRLAVHAPAEFKWPTVSLDPLGGGPPDWMQVGGPARVLSLDEWAALIAPSDPKLDTAEVIAYLNQEERGITSAAYAVAWRAAPMGRIQWLYETFSDRRRAEDLAGRYAGALLFVRDNRNWPDLWAMAELSARSTSSDRRPSTQDDQVPQARQWSTEA
jgi:hypothetical protein